MPTRALRWPRLWQAVGALGIATLVIVCVIPEPPDPLPLASADKLYHVLGYALLAGWYVQLYERGAGLIQALLALLALGLVLEAVQALLPWRSAEAGDALANAAGVGLGGLLAATPAARWLQHFERVLARR
ncbi:MAG TPA: VanZ family protein [Xanthomonadaceae bacterium]|nr:VanZ family protein [Xanthomonadaceae bacterium]